MCTDTTCALIVYLVDAEFVDIPQRGRHAINQSHASPPAHSIHRLGELDALISAIPCCHFVTAPVFGPPIMAENATLIIALSGEHRSKKEVAYTLVPAIGRRVLDLGGNVEKGELCRCAISYPRIHQRIPTA